MAGAVVAVIVLTYLLPAEVRVVPILEAVLLVALIIAIQGELIGAQTRCNGWQRRSC